MNKLPKYTRNLKGNLYYQRDIPSRIRHLSSKKTFTYPLTLKALNASETAITKALSTATEAYELHCKMLEESDPTAFNTEDLEKAALEVLRKLGHQHSTMPDSGIDQIKQKQKSGHQLSFEEQAQLVAHDNLLKAQLRKTQTMSNFWKEYASYKDLPVGTRETQRKKTRWLRWLATVGDLKIAPNTLNSIHIALDLFAAKRLNAVKASSVKRELNDILAILRHANQQHRYGWVIQPPKLPQSVPKARQVLTQEEQRKVVKHCLGNPHDPVAACILLQLQGAMMPTEVQRLTEDDMALDAIIPHIVVSGATKTAARKRIIPIVIGLDSIIEGLTSSIDWLRRTTESNHSHKIKTFLQASTGNDKLTGHCLRHTFRANCIAHGADTNSVAAIAGWSGSQLGISTEMLSYGAEGLANSSVLRGLQRETLKIHRHLIHLVK